MDSTSKVALNRMLITVAKKRASDLHLTVNDQPMVRVDGQLISLNEEVAVTADFLNQIAKILLTKEQQDILQNKKELTVIYFLNEQIRFKVQIFYQKGSLAMGWRLIPQKLKSLGELGLSPIVANFAKLKKGLVIIAGPFGSGRTTTVSSFLETINQERAEHIITIERPIEYIFTNKKSIIEQREVGRDTNSFADALKYCQEEDVDVVVVSELNTAEEISLALSLAGAGSLVLALMNSNSVAQVIEKIIFSFEPFKQDKVRNNLSKVLEGIIVQRLLSCLGGGQVLAQEILVALPPVRALIKDGRLPSLAQIMQTSRKQGMITLDQSLSELVQAGKVDKSVALAVALNPDDFRIAN